MRIPLATTYKNRTGDPDKDAKLKNAYVEVKPNQSQLVRKRPAAQGGVQVGFGTAQGGYGLVLFYGDTAYPITVNTGTTWSAGTSYLAGDHVSINFVDYWAINNNINSMPPSNNWSSSFRSKNYPLASFVWTQRTMPSIDVWNSIASNGSIFCAITNTNSAISTDGSSWTLGNLPSNQNWTDIAWNGTVFCAISLQGANNIITATSSDGINWTQHSQISTNAQFLSIAWNGTIFCVLTSGGTVSFTSPDGINWTQHANLLTAGVAWEDVIWNGTIFCGIANNGQSAISIDGITWTVGAAVAGMNFYGISWNGSVFCCPNNLGINSALSATSSDGLNWTTHNTLPVSALWRSIAWNGSVFCAVGSSSSTTSVSATSADGITWINRSSTMPTSNVWSDIAWGGNLFCAISNGTNLGLGSGISATSPMS